MYGFNDCIKPLYRANSADKKLFDTILLNSSLKDVLKE
jgi:hypothetical protein